MLKDCELCVCGPTSGSCELSNVSIERLTDCDHWKSFPNLAAAVGAAGQRGLPCLPAFGLCYATGSRLAPAWPASPFGVHWKAATGPHMLPLLGRLSLLLAKLTLLLLLLKLFHQQAVTSLFGLERRWDGFLKDERKRVAAGCWKGLRDPPMRR